MGKVIKCKRIHRHVTEINLKVINAAFKFFIKFVRKDFFTLDDLRNLNFSESFIDCVAMNKYFSDKEIEFISNMSDEETKAVTIIGRCYAERVDKSGNSLAGHSVRINKCLELEEEKIVALLHDIVEDGYLTFNNLKRFGFSESIIETVKILTRDKSEYPNYGDYINSIIESRNLIALKIKFWDMQDNQSPFRVKDLDGARREKATHKYKPYIPLVVLAIKELEDEQNIKRSLRLVA